MALPAGTGLMGRVTWWRLSVQYLHTSGRNRRMTSPSERHTSHFEMIPESRCKELLAVHTAGRIGWDAPDGPDSAGHLRLPQQ